MCSVSSVDEQAVQGEPWGPSAALAAVGMLAGYSSTAASHPGLARQLFLSLLRSALAQLACPISYRGQRQLKL